MRGGALLVHQPDDRFPVDPERTPGLDRLNHSRMIPPEYCLQRDTLEACDFIGPEKRLARQVSEFHIAPWNGRSDPTVLSDGTSVSPRVTAPSNGHVPFRPALLQKTRAGLSVMETRAQMTRVRTELNEPFRSANPVKPFRLPSTGTDAPGANPRGQVGATADTHGKRDQHNSRRGRSKSAP